MTSARSRQRAQDLTGRAQSLDPEQAGRVMIPFVVNALVTIVLQVLAAVVAVRVLRRAAKVSGGGRSGTARAAFSPTLLVVPAAVAYGRLSHAWLLRRALRQVPERSTE